MPALSYYTNVHDTAVALLERKGFQIWFEPETDVYFAERDGWDFVADDPVALLGLVAIYEAAGPSEHEEYWWRDRGAAGVTKRLPTKPRRKYVSVVDRKA